MHYEVKPVSSCCTETPQCFALLSSQTSCHLCRFTPVLGISRQTQGHYTHLTWQLARDEEDAEFYRWLQRGTSWVKASRKHLGHSPDCRGRLWHSPEPASTGYLHPVLTTLSALVWTADSALSFAHYAWAPPMQKQETMNDCLQDMYIAFITFSPHCVMFKKKNQQKTSQY